MIDLIFMFALLVFCKRFIVIQSSVVYMVVYAAFALYFATEAVFCVSKLIALFKKGCCDE